MGGKDPYHRPVVRILWISIREGYNDPLFVVRLVMCIHFLSVNPIIGFLHVFRAKGGRFKIAVAICGLSV